MNGKIFIYSGGSFLANRRLDTALLNDIKNPHILYIPTSIKDKKLFYTAYKKNVKTINKNANVFYYPLENFNPQYFIKKLDSIDIIYFAGGNTYDLIANLNKNKIKQYLVKFLKKDKIIACESAGAICLSPNINMASIPINTADANPRNEKTRKGLNLFNFEICPHFNKKYFNELKDYQELNQSIIYGIYDGSGILYKKNEKIQFIGKVILI